MTRQRWMLIVPGLIGVGAVGLGGCAPTFGLQPSSTPWSSTSAWQGPTVQVLVNHVACQLMRDYAKNRTDPDWQKLAQYHFVAAVGLNLSVTNNESVSPSFGFVTPLLGEGYPIKPITKNALNPMGDTSGTFNRTLTLGFQLSGSQTNNPTISYQLDMEKVADASFALQSTLKANEAIIKTTPVNSPGDVTPALQEAVWEYKIGEALRVDPDYKSLINYCDNSSAENGLGQTEKGDLLQGDLAMDYNIGAGLKSLVATQSLNIYGQSGPTEIADVGNNPAAGPASIDYSDIESAQNELNPKPAPVQGNHTLVFRQAVVGLLAKPVGGSGATGSSPGATAAGSASTSFAAVVTFNVVAGVNGGENWTLLLFKGPSGGGGGGAAGGAAGGGGAGGGQSSGGGGGGGGQPLSYTRTGTDTLTITYAPTCKANETLMPQPSTLNGDLPAASTNGDLPDISFTFTPPARMSLKDPGDRVRAKFSVTQSPAPTSGATYGTATSLLTLDEVDDSDHPVQRIGIVSVSWTIYKDQDGWNYVGAVSTIQNQTPLGIITISPEPDNVGQNPFTIKMTDDIALKANTNAPTLSYWDTIPGCDVTAGPYIQQVVAAAAAKTDTYTTQSKLGNAF